MANFNYDNLAANLPDAFAKDKNSNNYKLLKIEKFIYDRTLQIITSINDILDIDNATGATLDAYGKGLRVARGTLTDDQYRIRIKAKRAQARCDGTRDSVAEALAYVLSTDTSRIKIKSGNVTGDVILLDIPLETLKKAEFSTEQINEMINEMLPQGVSLSSSYYSGTFRLGATWGEKSAEKGLGNIEGTTGGTLGLVTR